VLALMARQGLGRMSENKTKLATKPTLLTLETCPKFGKIY
jgi:hypothetical protein